MYNKTILDNGAKIISERLDHLQSVSLGIWVDAGSRDEDESKNGISHFIEHMIFKGTAHRTSLQIAKELDLIGGLSNAFTGKEQTCFHGRVLARHFDMLAEIYSDIFLNSSFNSQDMDRERQVIFQEISMIEDTPDDNIHVLFNRSFWKDHPVGMSILGTDKSVSAITRETLLQYIKTYYIPRRVIVAAAGNIDHQVLVSAMQPMLECLPPSGHNPERTSPSSHAGISIHNKNLEQVHICLGGEAPSLSDDRRFACALLNTILGGNMSSRLFQEIRENQALAYSVYSFLSAYLDAGLLGVYLATDSQSVNPALQTIQREIRKIKKGELTESDLTGAKEHLIGSIYLGSESADSRMMRIAKNEFNFGRYVEYEELVDCLEKVSLDEVIQVADDIFQGDRVSFATLGPFDETALDQSNLQF